MNSGKMQFLTVLLAVFLIHAGLTAAEKTTESKITRVTVFNTGAQIFRTAATELPAGKTVLRFSGLSPRIDKNTVRVSGFGDFTILSVNHQVDYLTEKKDKAAIEDLKKRINDLNEKITREKTWIGVLKEKEDFLKTNIQLSGKDQAIQPEAFKTMDAYFAKSMETIRFSILEKTQLIEQYSKSRNDLQARLQQENGGEKLRMSEILVTVDAAHNTSARFELNYLVADAGWYPEYDIRVDDLSAPVSLNYKAQVHQHTGVDWKQVKLSFSNAAPDESATAPVLQPWFLDFYMPAQFSQGLKVGSEYAGYTTDHSIREVTGKVMDSETNEPIPFANIMATGTPVGTTSDFDGNFSLSIPVGAQSLTFSFVGYQTLSVPIYSRSITARMVPTAETLESVEIKEYKVPLISKKETAPVQTDIVRRETAFELSIETPYDIPSSGKPLSITMQTIKLPATYSYVSVPRIDTKAFLTAGITDWEKYNLISGAASLYFDKTYVGKSLLDVSSLNDTISISLGTDKNIIVKREKMKDFSKWQTIGSNKVQTVAWKISLRNTRDVPVEMDLRDQVPVSMNRDIEVDADELSGGHLNDDTGIVTWPLTLQPGETRTINLSYSVKYPKARFLNLD